MAAPRSSAIVPCKWCPGIVSWKVSGSTSARGLGFGSYVLREKIPGRLLSSAGGAPSPLRSGRGGRRAPPPVDRVGRECQPRRRLNRSSITPRAVGIRRNADRLARPWQVPPGEELPVLPYRRHDGVRDEAAQLVAERRRRIAQRRTIQRRAID